MAIFVHFMLHTEQKSLNLFSTIIKVMKNIVLQHRAELETLASKRYQHFTVFCRESMLHL